VELLQAFDRELATSLWEQLGDIPTNGLNDKTELRFLHFPPGTHREDIWHWFEEEFDLSVTDDLMYGKRNK
jgi:hypothetical protein